MASSASTLLTATVLGAILFTVFLAGCGEEPQQPNIVLVILDTVRDDFTAVGGSEENLTPMLDELAQRATVYANALATAPWTVPSHASIFTGLLPTEHGCTHQHTRLDPRWTTLAEILARHGYETAAFYSNPWLSDRTTGLLRGFALKQEAPLVGGLPGDPGHYRGDQGGRASNIFVRQWLQRRRVDTPFFLFVNFLEAHHPYDPPPRFRRDRLPRLDPADLVTSPWVMEFQAALHLPDEVDWERVRGLYGGDVNSSDNLLAMLMASLQQHGLSEDTILIVTSDHGEHLGEHGLIAHQFSVYESLLAVPLVIRAPGRLPVGLREDPVMLTDLFATILACAGIESVEIPRHSISLLSPEQERSRPLVAEYDRPGDHLLQSLQRLNPALDIAARARSFRTLRLGDLRLTLASDGTAELHDLSVDPGQEHNLAEARPTDVAALRNLLDQILAGTFRPTGEVEIDAATKEQLRSLGYIR